MRWNTRSAPERSTRTAMPGYLASKAFAIFSATGRSIDVDDLAFLLRGFDQLRRDRARLRGGGTERCGVKARRDDHRGFQHIAPRHPPCIAPSIAAGYAPCSAYALPGRPDTSLLKADESARPRSGSGFLYLQRNSGRPPTAPIARTLGVGRPSPPDLEHSLKLHPCNFTANERKSRRLGESRRRPRGKRPQSRNVEAGVTAIVACSPACSRAWQEQARFNPVRARFGDIRRVAVHDATCQRRWGPGR